MEEKTLCFLIRGNPTTEILLGFKKVRFGAGKYAGFGGGVEPGESITAAAIRELEEETAVIVLEENLLSVGHLTFVFPSKPTWNQVVRVFLVSNWAGIPVESEEMIPVWFSVNEIPHEQMWQDAVYWLPRILKGKPIRARFTFQPDNETVDQVEIETWDGVQRARFSHENPFGKTEV